MGLNIDKDAMFIVWEQNEITELEAMVWTTGDII